MIPESAVRALVRSLQDREPGAVVRCTEIAVQIEEALLSEAQGWQEQTRFRCRVHNWVKNKDVRHQHRNDDGEWCDVELVTHSEKGNHEAP